jgi:hypothetical protein
MQVNLCGLFRNLVSGPRDGNGLVQAEYQEICKR